MFDAPVAPVVKEPGLEGEEAGRLFGVGVEVLVGGVDGDGYQVLGLPVSPFPVVDIVSLALDDLMQLLGHVAVLPRPASGGDLLDKGIEHEEG